MEGYENGMRRFFRKHVLIVWIVLLVLLPIIIGSIYALPCKQYIKIKSEAVLSYYGTSAVVLFSVYNIIEQKKKDRSNRINSIRPRITLKAEKTNDSNILQLTITNKGEKTIFDLQAVETPVQKHLSPDDDIIMEVDISELTDRINGFPDAIPINCSDMDDNNWILLFNYIKDGNYYQYVLSEYGII